MDEIAGVDEILFFAGDISITKKWLIGLLGRNPVFESEGYVSFRLGNTTIGIHPSDHKTSPGVSGQVAYWRVKDLEKTKKHFIEHGCRLYRGPIIGVDGARICQLIDPFGNAWGLLEKRDDETR